MDVLEVIIWRQIMKKISIVVPCYNVENYVRETLDSIVGQSFGLDQIEVIVVDNGSTDGTLFVLQEYEGKYPDDILLVQIPENRMAGYARNIGLSYVSTNYVLFVDSDDWLFESAIEELYEKITRDELDVLEFVCRMGPSLERLTDFNHKPQGSYQIHEIDSVQKRKVFYGIGPKSGFPFTKLFRTSFLRENNIAFAEGLKYEDTSFIMFMLLYAKRYGIYDKALYGYRINPTGITFGCKQNDYGQFDRFKVQLQMLEECEKRGLLESFYEMIEANFIRVGFVETVMPVLKRFEYLPNELLELITVTKSFFPNYRNNMYLNLPQYGWMQKYLHILDLLLDEQVFQTLKNEMN